MLESKRSEPSTPWLSDFTGHWARTLSPARRARTGDSSHQAACRRSCSFLSRYEGSVVPESAVHDHDGAGPGRGRKCATACGTFAVGTHSHDSGQGNHRRRTGLVWGLGRSVRLVPERAAEHDDESFDATHRYCAIKFHSPARSSGLVQQMAKDPYNSSSQQQWRWITSENCPRLWAATTGFSSWSGWGVVQSDRVLLRPRPCGLEECSFEHGTGRSVVLPHGADFKDRSLGCRGPCKWFPLHTPRRRQCRQDPVGQSGRDPRVRDRLHPGSADTAKGSISLLTPRNFLLNYVDR